MALTKISGEVIQSGINIGIVTASTINVGSAVTIHTSGFQVGTSDLHSTGITVKNVNSTGVITATSFYGDGTNLTNTGSTLSAASGSQRVVLTGQTSGTMTASATSSSLSFNASTGALSATSFSGSGANLTGIAATTNVRTDSLVVSGITTATGGIRIGATTSITVGDTVIKSNSIGIGTTTTTGRNAGIGTSRGSIIYNSTNSAIEAYDGDGWFNVKSIGISSSMTVFTSSGIFIVPEGVYRIKVTITGAGGGGYGGTYNRGGGAGGTSIKYINVTPRQGIGVTIGSGGSGANVNAIAGTSHFGSFCSATGGRNAGDGDYGDTASNPGVGVDGDWNFYGGSAQTHDGGIVAGSKGGDSFWGGGARGKPNGRYYGSGGWYGGGGGGGTYSAGNGGDGVCVIEWNL